MTTIVSSTVLNTGFVFTMMVVVEYFNVLTRGSWSRQLTRSRFGQYIVAALLGAIPGCLGAFAVVTMYAHRVLSVGALVTAMIATSGDEAFVMLALIPETALLLMLIVFALGVLVGFLVDSCARRVGLKEPPPCSGLEVHEQPECDCFDRHRIVAEWRKPLPVRIALVGATILFLSAAVCGHIGPSQWNWLRLTLVLVVTVGLLVVATVPDHFLIRHLWNHIARRHLPHIFLWTLAALAVTHLVTGQLALEATIRDNVWVVMAIACVVGIIPQSGPHLFFLTLYVEGTVPFAVLLASSIVQDGHGMLPLLAHSRRVFVFTKVVNVLAGLAVGAAALVLGGA
ncbi:MAG: putative manganese transporter [Spirochaetia bacterium]